MYYAMLYVMGPLMHVVCLFILVIDCVHRFVFHKIRYFNVPLSLQNLDCVPSGLAVYFSLIHDSKESIYCLSKT